MRRLYACVFAGLTGLAALFSGGLAHAATAASVTVNAGISRGMIPSMAYGVNTAVWDGLLTDPTVPGLLQSVDTGALRYPGGSTSDVYHWQTNTQTCGGYCFPQDNFDGFMTSVAIPTGASPIITVNYGSDIAGTGGGQPSEAAAWVNYANNVKHYGIKYWEIGNEVYGNGEYNGVKWEEDLHSDHSPTTYGQNVDLYIDAMKHVDPTIKIGCVLALPGYWPEGVAPDWDDNVLQQCGKRIDFVIEHWYPQNPGSESDSFLLNSPSQIPAIIKSTRALLKLYCGARANRIKIFVTETNSVSSNPGRQTTSLVNALFLDDDYMTWLENGVTSVDWWALHNGATAGNSSPSLYGTTFFGDYGMLADSGLPEPGDDAPLPAYEGKVMLADFAAPGDTMVPSHSSNALLSVHAVKTASGGLDLMLINKDPANPTRAVVTIKGYTPGAISTAYFYGEGSTSVMPTGAKTGSQFAIVLPPYSVTSVNMTPSTLTTPVFVGSATASPGFTTVGGAFQIAAQVTDKGASYSNAIVDLEVHNSSGAMVFQKFFAGVNLTENQVHTYKVKWVPSSAGQYSFEVGVFSPSWAQKLYWNSSAAPLTVNAADTSQYGFEGSVDGWLSSGGMIASFEPSTTQAFAGSSSLEVDFNAVGADTQSVYVNTPTTPAGAAITFEVWIPADTTISWVQPFAQEGAAGNYAWHGDWQPIANLQGNAWNTFTVAVPSTAAVPLLDVGVQFDVTGAWTGTCYVDSVGW